MKRVTAAVTCAIFIGTSCGGKTTTTPTVTPLGKASPLTDQVLVQTKDLPPGLDMHVTNGRSGAPAFDRAKLAAATKLSEADVQALLSRARPIQNEAGDQQAFALRPKSQPPPRTGQTIKGAFPPAPSTLLPPKSNDAGKDLKVLRFAPEGAVPIAPELSITFSQPMVAVTSQEDAAKTTPVRLTPQPKGNWRWIGTRTILFDPDVRFPQATTYTVEIPAGTKSTNGGALKDATKFTFETPPPTMVSSYPSQYQPQKLDVPMFALFDQRIDQAAVLKHIKVTANKAPVAIELFDPAKDKQLAAVVDSAKKNEQDGRWLAFHATQPFPKDAQISVELGAGLPSAEGPNPSKTAQSFSFHTYPPLEIRRAECGYGDVCRPGMPFSIEFNNPLDDDKWDDALLTIAPDINDVKIIESGASVSVMGVTKARTTYKVLVSGGVVDSFGQTLGKDVSLTFPVGDAYPTFFGPEGMVVLDPGAKKPTLDFFTTNYEQIKVKLYQVEPKDYDAWLRYQNERWNHDHPPAMPGSKVVDTLVKTTNDKNALFETSVALDKALKHAGLTPGDARLGHAIAIIEPYPWKERYEPPRLEAWVQSTRIAVDAYVDGDQMIAFATELGTGKPAAGVELVMHPFGIKAKTDDRGLATLPLGTRALKTASYLTAQRGDDVAFITDDYGGGWLKQTRPKSLAWYVTDDRQMYKPGEEVNLKGWLRTLDPGKNGDVAGITGAVSSVNYKVYDGVNNQIGAGSAAVSPVGGFDTKFTLPKTPNLGYARVEFESQGRMHETFSHGFQIQEFRRPEFEVNAQASQGPFVVGGSGDISVSAKYFAGGPLPGAAVNWFVTAAETSYTPPNRDDYVFGTWVPWWGYRGYYDDDEGGGRYKAPKTWSLAGKTDATGEHVMHMDFLSENPQMPMTVNASASVTDVNRQTWAAQSTVIVHPSTYYVGLKTKKPFVEKGQPFDIDVIGVDLDGKAVPGAKIEVKAVRLDWQFKKGKYKQLEVDPQTCEVTAAKDAVPCQFATKSGGTYQVTATIVDGKGRANQTKLEFWVTGGDVVPAREVKQELVQLIPDRKEYANGQTAELLVQAPFYPAEGVVTWRRSGIVETQRVTLGGPTTTIKVPITDAMVPNMYVQVDLVGMAARTDDKGDPDPKLPKRPAYAVGTIDLPVPPKQRTLAVTVSPAAPKLGPGEETKLSVDVRDAQGRPVAGAETAVIVVDEAVLSLTGYKFQNPIDTFYGQRDAGARDIYERAYVKLAKPDVTKLAQNGAPGGGERMKGFRVSGAMAADAAPVMAPAPEEKPMPKRKLARGEDKEDEAESGGGSTKPIAVRTNFNPLAAFSPAVKTDGNGHAVVDLKMPDNLTRYRIVAIAAAGDRQFGKGESAVTARLPLMVRPSPPRFLNFGDTFKLPVVLQNQTDAAMTVKVAVRATNAAITDGAGRQVTVPPNDRVEVQFPAAAELAGTARFQIVGSAGSASDAAELALPVWTPATTEAFATYGVIDDGAIKQQVQLPEKVIQQFGGLEVQTASTNLQALTDALLYLVHYKFDCAEQRSSRILAIAALRDVLEQFHTKDMPSRAALEKSVADDIEHLSQMQNYDGGYAYWDRGYPSEPYLTVFVTNALSHAKAKGFAVPQQMIDRAKPYLQSIEQHYPWYYPESVRRAISAYALYTRKQIGDLDIAKGKKLFAQWGVDSKDTTMETDGWLLGLFAGNKDAADERKAIVRYAMNHVSETAGAANFTTGYADGAYLLLSSDRRVDGVMLESLIQEDQKSDLIPKVVTGLLAHRKAGHWLNTQENSFILLALDLYFQTYEKVTPDFVARVWLGDDYAGDHPFKGRQTDRFEIDIPMKDVASHDRAPLTIQKDGKGRMYYRIGMTYAPASLKLEPADYGFVVERRYEAVDDPKDVSRDAQGVWHIKAGARVRVKLTMVNENRRYMVALVDPLPAGLETMNPALAVTGPIPKDPKEQQSRGRYWWWMSTWYDHQNMRDERVEAFSSLLWEGVHTYDYVARATTPGNFVVPPPKAEEMYMPETFGRGASDRVVVE